MTTKRDASSGHTPTPWKWTGDRIVDAKNDTVIDDGSAGGEYKQVIDPKGPNAAFIVRAVNAHEELLKAAKAAVNHLLRCEKDKIERPFKSAALPLLQAAIAKAEGK